MTAATAMTISSEVSPAQLHDPCTLSFPCNMEGSACSQGTGRSTGHQTALQPGNSSNLKRKHSQHIRHAAAHCPNMQHGVRIPAPRSGMTTPPLHARPPSTTCIATWSTVLHSSRCTCRCVLSWGNIAPIMSACSKIFCQHWHAQPVRSLQIQTGACARLKGGLSIWKHFAKLLHIHVRLQAAHVICW